MVDLQEKNHVLKFLTAVIQEQKFVNPNQDFRVLRRTYEI
jgi:hypothetical protein